MDNQERYYEKLEEAEMLLQHYKKCIDDVSGTYPDDNLKINGDKLRTAAEKYQSALDSLHSATDPQEAMGNLIRVCSMMRSKLEEWHNRGLTDKYDQRYLTNSDGSTAAPDAIDDTEAAEGDTRVYNPDR